METHDSNTIIDSLERTEKLQPGSLSVENYVRMMLYYLHQKAPREVEFLWARIPEPLKNDPLLVALVEVASNLADSRFSKVYPVFNKIIWPEGLASDAEVVSKRLVQLSIGHIRRTYDVIKLDRMADILGESTANIKKWVAGIEFFTMGDVPGNVVTLAPLLPGEVNFADLDEESEWINDLDSLGLISDTVWSLSKKTITVDEPSK